jgi:hypothetical protein
MPKRIPNFAAIGDPIPDCYSDPSGLLGSHSPEETLLLLADHWPWGEVWPGDISAADEFEVKNKQLARLGYRTMGDYLEHGSPARKKFDEWFASRSSPKCHICGIQPTAEAPAVHIQVHHLSYRSFGDEKPRDLLPLCKPHHTKVHQTQHELGGRNSLSWYVAYERFRHDHELPACPAG